MEREEGKGGGKDRVEGGWGKDSYARGQLGDDTQSVYSAGP